MELNSRKNRKTPEQFTEQLMPYDVVSFDVFDTAIFRKVDMPNDVFSIMAIESGYGAFSQVRKEAEMVARERKEAAEGTREVSLVEIYDVMAEDYGIDPALMEQEITLELKLTEANPYIYQVYRKLREKGKPIIFISDMYLPQSVIEEILQKSGYTGYEKLYLSNSYKLRKGDGTLQRAVMAEYPDQKLIHVGDSPNGDVDQSISAGMDVLFYEDAREVKPEGKTDSMSGSLYRAVINNCMYSGTWNENIYYSHGFRNGGILAAGYCEYINQVVKSKNIDKILFCARDCEVLWKLYNRYYKECENEYIAISRYAVTGISLERYLYEWAGRFMFRYVGPDSTDIVKDKTVAEVLREGGADYLNAYLPEMGLDGNMLAAQTKRGLFKRFVFSHADIIRKHNEENVEAARRYYRDVIGNAKNVLVVDVGWSGTCITALKYFVETHLQELSCRVSGTLMCTSAGKSLKRYMEMGVVSSYIYSPYHNRELLDFMQAEELAEDERVYRNLSLEQLFTSSEGTLVRYGLGSSNVTFERAEVKPQNEMEIHDMQEGMLQFVQKYQEYKKSCGIEFMVSPHVAFKPLMEACLDREYMRHVYCNFEYGASWKPNTKSTEQKHFGECFRK